MQPHIVIKYNSFYDKSILLTLLFMSQERDKVAYH